MHAHHIIRYIRHSMEFITRLFKHRSPISWPPSSDSPHRHAAHKYLASIICVLGDMCSGNCWFGFKRLRAEMGWAKVLCGGARESLFNETPKSKHHVLECFSSCKRHIELHIVSAVSNIWPMSATHRQSRTALRICSDNVPANHKIK